MIRTLLRCWIGIMVAAVMMVGCTSDESVRLIDAADVPPGAVYRPPDATSAIGMPSPLRCPYPYNFLQDYSVEYGTRYAYFDGNATPTEDEELVPEWYLGATLFTIKYIKDTEEMREEFVAQVQVRCRKQYERDGFDRRSIAELSGLPHDAVGYRFLLDGDTVDLAFVPVSDVQFLGVGTKSYGGADVPMDLSEIIDLAYEGAMQLPPEVIAELDEECSGALPCSDG